MADLSSLAQTVTNAGATASVLTSNYNKMSKSSGLAGKIFVVKVAKTNMTDAEVNTIVKGIEAGNVNGTDDAGVIVGMGTADGSAFVSATTDVLFLHIQTTGTITADGTNAYAVTGAVTTIENIVEPKL
mgnify:FL=1|jgi:hypothetical protein